MLIKPCSLFSYFPSRLIPAFKVICVALRVVNFVTAFKNILSQDAAALCSSQIDTFVGHTLSVKPIFSISFSSALGMPPQLKS